MSPPQLATESLATEALAARVTDLVPVAPADDEPRNLSPSAYFRDVAARHVPRYRFAEGTEFAAWKAALLPAVRETLGRTPQPVPLNPTVHAEWNEHGLVKQRVVFDVEEHLSAVAYVFRPETSNGHRLPAILCCHGHTPFGKDSVMGNRATAQQAQDVESVNYDYGLQMARAGFVTIAIDWRGFGERDDARKPNHRGMPPQSGPGRDMCNVNYLRATVLGMTVLGMDVHDARCALDYLCQQPFVDPERIGVMGLSFGGTMTTWTTLCDERIKAADIICYSDRFADMGIRDLNFCGSQITPGLYELCDIPDLHGLIAPRPLLVEIGAYDECFKLDSAMSCYREVERIYAAADARDRLELDLFDGGHRWGANKSLAFFRRYL